MQILRITPAPNDLLSATIIPYLRQKREPKQDQQKCSTVEAFSDSRTQPTLISSTSPQRVENIPKTEIIRVIPGPFKPGHQPSPIRRNTIATNPVVAAEHLQLERRPHNQRSTMPRHSAPPPTAHADAPRTNGASPATHPTRTPTANPDAASQTPCEPGPRVHTTATTPQPATHQDQTATTPAKAPPSTAAYDASASRPHSAARSSASFPLGTWLFQRPCAAVCACRCPGRMPDS